MKSLITSLRTRFFVILVISRLFTILWNHKIQSQKLTGHLSVVISGPLIFATKMSESENPSDIEELADTAVSGLLPDKSKDRYDIE